MARAKSPNTQTADVAVQEPPVALSVKDVFSFLKEMKGELSWTARDMSDSLKIGVADVKRALPLLELQGYVKPEGKSQWITTSSGEAVAGAKAPRFNREAIEKALTALQRQIRQVNQDTSSEFKVTKAVAFGDFLRGASRVQAPDIGIQAAQRGPAIVRGPMKQHRAMREFLTKLRGRRAVLNLIPYEEWMRTRSHRDLL